MSHICNLTILSPILTLKLKNSKPTVAIYEFSNKFFVAFIDKQLFPTPGFPITIILNEKSYFL